MVMNGINQTQSQSVQMNSTRTADIKSKGLQNQITAAQQQLQKLSSDQDLTVEEKKQKRQEVQQQITELNRELRQRQMELRKEQAEKQNSEDMKKQEADKERRSKETIRQTTKEEKTVDDDKKASTEKPVVPQKGIEAVISAETAQKQAMAQHRVMITLEGKLNAIQGEINQEAKLGHDTKHEEEVLADMKKRVSNTSRVQIRLLSDASRKINKLNSTKEQQNTKPEAETAGSIGADISDTKQAAPQNAIQRYNAGKLYSSVAFQV